MKETNKWSVRDGITTVLISTVLIVIQLDVNIVCMANDFLSMVLSVGITMFLCAPVYMLMVSRIGKRLSLIHICAGLRLRRRGEHEETTEKMPTGYREGHRLFARQRGENQKGQRDRHR